MWVPSRKRGINIPASQHREFHSRRKESLGAEERHETLTFRHDMVAAFLNSWQLQLPEQDLVIHTLAWKEERLKGLLHPTPAISDGYKWIITDGCEAFSSVAQLLVSHICVLLWAAPLAQLLVSHMCVLLWATATSTSDWNLRCVLSSQIFLLLGHPCQILLRLRQYSLFIFLSSDRWKSYILTL